MHQRSLRQRAEQSVVRSNMDPTLRQSFMVLVGYLRKAENCVPVTMQEASMMTAALQVINGVAAGTKTIAVEDAKVV
jgi:hypothetical protein